MRQIMILIAVISLFACNNSNKDYVKRPNDTLKTIVKFIWPNNGALMENYAFRITKDSFITKPDTMGDVIRLNSHWDRVSFYNVPIVDSLRREGKAVYDSVNKTWFTTYWIKLSSKYIYHDFNINTLKILGQ
jgi:hypothetical protein